MPPSPARRWSWKTGASPRPIDLSLGERPADGHPIRSRLRHGFSHAPDDIGPALPGLVEAVGTGPLDVAADAHNYLAVLESEQVVRELAPDIAAIARLDLSGVIVTARSNGVYDFVSRYFAPAKGIAEDSVTGGAHCALGPYWATRLRQTAFRAFQASQRGGEVLCRLVGDRVELEGNCVFYLEGDVEI